MRQKSIATHDLAGATVHRPIWQGPALALAPPTTGEPPGVDVPLAVTESVARQQLAARDHSAGAQLLKIDERPPLNKVDAALR